MQPDNTPTPNQSGPKQFAWDSARDAARQYDTLLRIVRAVSEASTMGEALEAIHTLLRDRYGVLAIGLEVVSGQVTRFLPYGQLSALSAMAKSAKGDSRWRVHVCPLNDPAAPPGEITYILSRDAPFVPDLLEAATTQLALRLGQETLIKRAEDAEDKARQRISEVATIYEIGKVIDQIEHKSLLQMITDRAALLMEAQACSLMLVNVEEGCLRVEASHGLPDDAMDQVQNIGDGFAGRVAKTEQPLLVVDANSDPRLEGMTLRPDIGSSMLVPMKDQAGRVLGVLSIRRRRPAPDFTDDDLKLFSVFATQAGLALTNVKLYEDLKRRAGELSKISALSRALISTLKLDEMLPRIADDICSVVGFERCCLFLRDPQRRVFVPRVWRGYSDSIGRNPVGEGEGAIGVAALGKGALLFDARETVSPEREREKTYLQMKGFARSLGTVAFVAVPILTSQNRCIGVVVADNKGRREPISQEQRQLLSAFVNQAGIAIENAQYYELMQDNYRNIQRLNDYMDNVLRSIGTGIVSTDTRGSDGLRIARWNWAAEKTLGQALDASHNASLLDTLVKMGLPESEVEHLTRMIQRVMETGESVHLHKLTLHPQERAPLTLNLTISRLMDHNQECGGVVLSLEDVTQEVRLEAELDKMRRLADIGQLAAKMAHEVRNALSPIRGAAQIIRVEMEAQTAGTEWPDIIIAEVDGLSGLTSAMLDFARPTPLDPRPMTIDDFLEGAVQALAPFLTEHRVNVQWALAPNMPELLADPVQLGQVVRNIVMNAAQAMPDGGALCISTDFDTQACALVVRFRDTGVGIAREDQERIFRPFVTTKTKGTGLGLPIVQKIVDHHGGRVEVESRIGEGTCFSVWLPLTPPLDMPPTPPPVIDPRPPGPFPDN